MILSLVGALCLLLTALVLWTNARETRHRAIEQANDRVESLLGEGKVAEARAVLTELDGAYPGASRADEFARAADRLAAAVQKEDERLSRFARALDEARETPLGQERDPAVEAARALAVLPDEKAQVERIAATRRAVAEKERALVDEALRPRLVALRERIGAAESLVRRSPKDPEVGGALSALRSELPDLNARAARASADVRERAEAVIAKIEAVASARTAGVARERLLDDLARAAGLIQQASDLTRYVAACDRFAQQFPEDPRG